MTKIYVVFGSTGEYSDHSEWMVKAFSSEESAKTLVLKATSKAMELFSVRRKHNFYREKGLNEFDPNMNMYSNGTSYCYREVELD